MNLPKPEIGLVVNYSYLWHREAKQGHVEGRKDRPCAVILVARDDRVIVSPITHTMPSSGSKAIEIPGQDNIRVPQANPPANRGGGSGMIAGDHLDIDPGLVTLRDGRDRFRSGRCSEQDRGGSLVPPGGRAGGLKRTV